MSCYCTGPNFLQEKIEFWVLWLVKVKLLKPRNKAPPVYPVIMVEGVACPNNSRCSDVWGFFAPGKATHDNRVLGEGLDKAEPKYTPYDELVK